MLDFIEEFKKYKDAVIKISDEIKNYQVKLAEYQKRYLKLKTDADLNKEKLDYCKNEISRLEVSIYDAKAELKEYLILANSYYNIIKSKKLDQVPSADVSFVEEYEKSIIKVQEDSVDETKSEKNYNIQETDESATNGAKANNELREQVKQEVERCESEAISRSQITPCNIVLLPVDDDILTVTKIKIFKSLKNWIGNKKENVDRKKKKAIKKIEYVRGPIDFSNDILKKNEDYKPKVLVKQQKTNPFDLIDGKGNLKIK